MHKDITAIILVTMLSAISIPTTATIYGIKYLNEVLSFPHDLESLGLFANLILTSGFTGLLFGLFAHLLYYKALKKAYLVVIFLLSLLLTAVEVFCLAKFGLSISSTICMMIADTNTSEMADFFQMYFDIFTLMVVMGISIIGYLLWRLSGVIYRFVADYKKLFFTVFVMLVIFSLAGVKKIGGYNVSPPIIKTFHGVKYFLKVRRRIAKMSSDKTNRTELTADRSDTPHIVFIIGESASKHFMGIYNNRYDSTPYAQKLVDSKNMFVFTDTISMKSTTLEAMTLLLSFMENTTETTDIAKFDSIIDVFKKANYQTFWLSNQAKTTRDFFYAEYVSNRCDYTTFVAKASGNLENIASLVSTDEALLLPLDNYLNHQAMQKEKNFFILHLMASHFTYSLRYPESFNRFQGSDIQNTELTSKQKQLVAEYVNTLYYTDYLLNEIISRFKDKDAILIYVPDHAEELWQSGYLGHGAKNLSKYMLEIPMLIWVSDIYKTKRLDNIKRVENALNKPFMTDNLVHVLLDLAGIETKQYDPSKSVINEAYVPRERLINRIRYEDLRE